MSQGTWCWLMRLRRRPARLTRALPILGFGREQSMLRRSTPVTSSSVAHEINQIALLLEHQSISAVAA